MSGPEDSAAMPSTWGSHRRRAGNSSPTLVKRWQPVADAEDASTSTAWLTWMGGADGARSAEGAVGGSSPGEGLAAGPGDMKRWRPVSTKRDGGAASTSAAPEQRDAGGAMQDPGESRNGSESGGATAPCGPQGEGTDAVDLILQKHAPLPLEVFSVPFVRRFWERPLGAVHDLSMP